MLELGVSPGKFFFAMFKVKHGVRTSTHNLAAIYPRAVVKASILAGAKEVDNVVPANLRYFCGQDVKQRAGNRAGPRCTTLPFGKYAGKSVKQVARRDPSYLEWFIRNVNPYETKGSNKWNVDALDAMAWIIYYRPELAANVTGGGPLFSGYSRPAKLIGAHEEESE